MADTKLPKYRWGQPVYASTDLNNDGTYPGAAHGELLIKRGTRGEIVQTGLHEESNTPVYLVEFPAGKVIGCLEQEIASVPAPDAAEPVV